MRRHLGILSILVLALMLVFAIPVSAATTQDVAVNATPAFVTITNAPDNWGFGVVATSTNYSTAVGEFTITNGSTVAIDISIGCNSTWAGGNDWTHDDTGTPGATTAALYATPNTVAWNVIVKNSAPQNLVTSLAASTPQDWGLRLMAPTSFDDGVLKTTTVTLTASAS